MALLALLALLGGGAAALGPAQAQAQPRAADGYRYWSLWQQDQKKDGTRSWSYSTQGPSTLRPEDGDVLGFRFAVGEDAGSAATPREKPRFGPSCEDTGAEPGSKRVAVTVDFGTSADAPDSETPPKPRTSCARIDEDATGAEALAAVAEPLRYSSDSLLCAIEGYPERGCGEQVSGDSTDSPDSGAPREGQDDPGDGGLPAGAGIGAGVAAVAVLGAAAYWQARRRR